MKPNSKVKTVIKSQIIRKVKDESFFGIRIIRDFLNKKFSIAYLKFTS